MRIFEAKRRLASRPIRRMRVPGDPREGPHKINQQLNENFVKSVDELNTRFRQAGCKLHYHNGFIQLSEDALFLREAEQPFWHLVADELWKNVDTDMKEAIDRRDGDVRDPVFYAARALESTIKIISDQMGWTHGGEKGAHNYIDNLGKKTSGFVERWEADSLKNISPRSGIHLATGPEAQKCPA